jgi:hypothetical protein
MNNQHEQTILDRLKAAALTGAVAGAGTGAVSSLLGGAKKLKQLVRPSLIGAGVGSVAAPAGIGAGEAVMGAPDESEKSPYTMRGLAGGAALGALAGGGIGGVLSAGKRLKLSKLGSFGDKIKDLGKTENIVFSKLRQYADNPSRANIIKGILLGTGVGGLAGANFASDQGMNIDAIRNEIERRQMKKARDNV